MIKKDKFESFLSQGSPIQPLDLSWNSNLQKYSSSQTQKFFQFYNDIIEFDLGYKTSLLKALGVCFLPLGMISFSIIFCIGVNDYILVVLQSPIKEIVSLIISLVFLVIFLSTFIIAGYKIFKTQ